VITVEETSVKSISNKKTNSSIFASSRSNSFIFASSGPHSYNHVHVKQVCVDDQADCTTVEIQFFFSRLQVQEI